MTTPTRKQPMDHLKSRKKPVRKTVWIAGDNQLVEDLSSQKDELVRERGVIETLLTKMSSPESSDAVVKQVTRLEEIKITLASLETQIQEASIKFVFQALPRKVFDDLPDSHKPTPEQVTAAKETGLSDNLPFNPDTYPMAIVVACIVEPESSPEELEEWLSGPEWNGPEFMTLYLTAMEVNNTRKIIDAGNASSGMRFSG